MEKIHIFVECLVYEAAFKSGKKLPRIVCAITGKGPQKEYYQDIIAKMALQQVQFCTPWLTAEDYAMLLGKDFIEAIKCSNLNTSFNRFII